MKNAWKIKWFSTLDSTNDELLRHIQAYDNLSVIAAEAQTAGRGQRGNSWLTEPGENLTFSILLKADIAVDDFMRINLIAATAVRDFLTARGIAAQVKWPNDIYVGKRKICGMLVENGIADGRIAWSVTGIGINMNQRCFPETLMNPTSMRLQTGLTYEPRKELECFMEIYASKLELTSEELLSDYQKGLFQKGIPAHYRDMESGHEFIGTIKEILPDGRILIQSEAGESRLYRFKEVGYIL